MDRKDTTSFLLDTLIRDRLTDRKYYAREVTLDYGTRHPKRIDVMQFVPQGVTYASDIEKGIFICYEIKSCKQDVYSGHGLNFYGEKNYIVTTMETYKELQPDIRDGTLTKHIMDLMGEKTIPSYGFLVPVPGYIDLRKTSDTYAEYENPTPIDSYNDWKFWLIYESGKHFVRLRSTNELLFCMLRAKHNNSY